jgi:hypothetical protein
MMRTKITAGLVLITLAGIAAALYGTTSHAAASRITGGSPNQQALLNTEASKVPAQDIANLTLSSPPPDDIANGVSNLGSNWLYVTGKATSLDEAVIVAWEAGLIGSTYADDATSAGLPNLTGITVDVNNAAGQTLDEQNWFVPTAAEAPPAALNSNTAAAMADIQKRFESGANTTNAKLVGITFYRIPRLSAVATIETNQDPGIVVSNMFATMSTLIGDGSNVDGWAVRVVDQNGGPILTTAHSPRLLSSETWIRPSLEADYPYAATQP